MMDYDCRSSEKRLAAVENDWLAAPENAELLEVYTCSLCGNHIFEGDEYLAVDCCGEVCSECLEGLTASRFRQRPNASHCSCSHNPSLPPPFYCLHLLSTYLF